MSGARLNKLNVFIQKIDQYQRTHQISGFLYAVTKKYSEDEGGYQASLITYYAFLSLFPLFLALTSLLRLLLNGEQHFKTQLINNVTNIFPVLGSQLQRNVHATGKTGLALAISIVLTLYGARGAADALRRTLNHVWQVPRIKRAGFPKNILKSMSVIFTMGIGVSAASTLSAYTLSRRGLPLKAFVAVATVIIVFITLLFVFRAAVSGQYKLRDMWRGALIAAIGIEILQVVGVYVVGRELRHLDSLYGTFAVVLGLIFWIYLQTQVVIYAIEIDSVWHFHLWPRSITLPLTSQDRQAYDLYAAKEAYLPQENLVPRFGRARQKRH